jgi:hypothetical protein
MLKKIRKAVRKIGPMAFILVTMTTTHLSSFRNVIARTID